MDDKRYPTDQDQYPEKEWRAECPECRGDKADANAGTTSESAAHA
jgi:Zn finger protein HypA/HybF involved in hydrogenase expression